MKTWFIFFGLWLVACLGAYVWLTPSQTKTQMAPVVKAEEMVETEKIQDAPKIVKKKKKKKKPEPVEIKEEALPAKTDQTPPPLETPKSELSE